MPGVYSTLIAYNQDEQGAIFQCTIHLCIYAAPVDHDRGEMALNVEKVLSRTDHPVIPLYL